MRTLVVTRHQALVEYLVEEGIVDEFVPVVAHATEDDVRGRHVYGVLPQHLASVAMSVTEIPLAVPPELRGVELSVDQVRQFAGPPTTYCVFRVQSQSAAAYLQRVVADHY